MNKNDLRYIDIKNRLSGLTNKSLRRIIEAIEANEICLDTYRYDEQSEKYCAIAIALEVPEFLSEMGIEPTNKVVEQIVGSYGSVSGVPGEFYRTPNRGRDLGMICGEILLERGVDSNG